MTTGQRKSVWFFLIVALLFLIVGFWGTIRLTKQPGVDLKFEQSKAGLRVREVVQGGKAQKAGKVKLFKPCRSKILLITGHAAGETPGLFSNPEVKTRRVWFGGGFLAVAFQALVIAFLPLQPKAGNNSVFVLGLINLL